MWWRGGCASRRAHEVCGRPGGRSRDAGTGYGAGGTADQRVAGLADTLVDDYDVIDMLNRLAGYSVHPLLPSRTEI